MLTTTLHALLPSLVRHSPLRAVATAAPLLGHPLRRPLALTAPMHGPGLRVLFFGSDSFALPVLVALHRVWLQSRLPTDAGPRGSESSESSGVRIAHLEAIVPPPKPFGKDKQLRRVPIHDYCLENGIPVHLAPSDAAVSAWKDWSIQSAHSPLLSFPLTAVDAPLPASLESQPQSSPSPPPPPSPYDIGVVVSFGRFLPAALVKSFHLGAVNIHPSLLPKYRGAAPIQRAIMNGDAETGISVIEVSVDKFDAGRILHQEALPIPPHCSSSELLSAVAEKCPDILLRVLAELDVRRENAVRQNETLASKAPKVFLQDGFIDWSQHTAKQVFDKHRGLRPFVSLRTQWKSKRVELFDLFCVPPAKGVASEPAFPSWAPKSVREHPGVVSETRVLDALALSLAPADQSAQRARFEQLSASPGAVVYDPKLNLLYIACADRRWVAVRRLQFELKSEILPIDFFNGHLSGGTSALDIEQARFEPVTPRASDRQPGVPSGKKSIPTIPSP